MSSRHRPYPHYRDSGIEWLGQIPSHWEVRRAKYIFARMQRPVREEDGIVTCFRDGQVTLREKRRTEGFTFAIKEIGYQGIRTGDLVIHAMDAFAGAVGVSDSDGKCSPVYSICQPLDEEEVDTRYYARLIRQMAMSDFINALARGIRERSTEFRWNEFAQLALPLPPLDEQRVIADFLDRETARLDALITAKRRLIELLKEKRAALISHVVTRGLDPSAPLRDSGIEWLGEIPEHWSVTRLHYITQPNRPIMYGIVLPGPNVEDGVPIVKGGDVAPGRLSIDSLNRTTHDIEAGYVRSRLKGGDIVYAIRGSIGAAEIVPDELEGANLTQDAARIAPGDDIDRMWLLFAVSSVPFFAQLDAGAIGATIRGINIRDLKRARLTLPSLWEQQDISKYLGFQRTAIDQLIDAIDQGVALIYEYRTALIAAAVTGQIDVRE